MAQFTSVVSKLTIVAVVLLLAFVLLYLPAQIHESFVSSSQLVMRSQEKQGILAGDKVSALQSQFEKLNNLESLSDSNNLLKVKRCYQLPYTVTKRAVDTNEFGVYTTRFDGLFPSMTQIEERIVQEIVNFKDSIPDDKIKGNVYALIFQVPYYKNDKGNPINAGYYTKDRFDFWPSAERSDVYYQVFVIFASYDRYKDYQQDSTFECGILPILDKFASNDKQCYIRCKNSNVACGCASSEPGLYPDDPAYKIKCFGRDTVAQDELAISSFGILYTLNTQSTWVAKYFS